MKLTKLGKYIELLDNRNTDLKYGIKDVRGINNLKKMMPTRADMTGRKFDNFYVVYPNEFVFNPQDIKKWRENLALLITMKIGLIFSRKIMLCSESSIQMFCCLNGFICTYVDQNSTDM